MQIAVLLNGDGVTSNFGESGEVVVYEYLGDHWEAIKNLPYDVSKADCMPALRSYLRELGEQIMPCGNLVASKLVGIAYTTFEVMGFQMWEIEGKPEQFLDNVRVMEIERLEDENNVKSIPLPEPTPLEAEGEYMIDLEEAKQYFTSKQVLFPFLEKGGFKSLKIACSHVPPWFERELAGKGYSFTSERTEERHYMVTVTPTSK